MHNLPDFVTEVGGTAEHPQVDGTITREKLETYPSTSLGNPTGREGESTLTVYDLPQGRALLKEWRPELGRMARWWILRCARKEIAHYRKLQGVPGIPKLLAVLDERTLLLEYVDARPIGRDLPRETLLAAIDNFESILWEIHQRKFVHLDVRHKGNVLVSDEGKVWIIDLGQGMDCSRGVIRRLLFPFLQRIDRSAVVKFRARYASDTLPEKIRSKTTARYRRRRVRWLDIFKRIVLRVVLPGRKTPLRLRPRHQQQDAKPKGPA